MSQDSESDDPVRHQGETRGKGGRLWLGHSADGCGIYYARQALAGIDGDGPSA
jgi:hypothetical protein